MFDTIKTLIAVLPALLRLLSELSAWLKQTFGENPVKQIQDYTDAIERLKNAKSPQEKSAAASELSALIRRL